MNRLDSAIKAGVLLRDLTPYSNIDPFDAAEKLISGHFFLPHVGEITLSYKPCIDWGTNFETNDRSSKLWLYSLVFIDYLVKSYALDNNIVLLKKSEEIFHSFIDWSNSAKENYDNIFLDEHCVSNRVMILLQFLHVLSRSDDFHACHATVARVQNHIFECCSWLIDDNNYAFNNHGIIMDRALLSASVYLENLYAKKIVVWRECALRRLDIMIKRTFDNDGCCTENSTSYHVLNVALFRAVKDFMQRNEIAGFENGYEERLDRAIKSLAYQIYEDGSLPLIGDSYSKPSVFLNKELHNKVYGAVVYPESGLLFIKQRGFYFSFKCGGLTTSHRHVDDTSITLQVGGRNFICDGGMQSYDPLDKIRNILSSYKSHSGVFTEDCEFFRFRNYKSPDEISRIVSYRCDQDFVIASGRSNLDAESVICREVVWPGTKCFFIFDHVSASRRKKWRVQFLLHPDVAFFIGKDSLKLSNGGFEVFLNFVVSDNYDIDIEPGYYSESFMGARSTNLVVLSGVGCEVDIKTFIRIVN